jgi:hypothetical protein
MNTDKESPPLQTIPLSLETAKIEWAELQRFFAAGNVYQLQVGLDLPVLAEKFKSDDAEYIKQLLNAGNLKPVSDDQARKWINQNAIVWAVVIAPFVLVQGLGTESN